MPATGDYLIVGAVACLGDVRGDPGRRPVGPVARVALRTQRPHGAHAADPGGRRAGDVRRVSRRLRGGPPDGHVRSTLRPQLRAAGDRARRRHHHRRRSVGRHQGPVGAGQGHRNRARRARPRLVRRHDVLLPHPVPRRLLPVRRLDPARHGALVDRPHPGHQPHRRPRRARRRHRRHRCGHVLPLRPATRRPRLADPTQPGTDDGDHRGRRCASGSFPTTSTRRGSSWATAAPCCSGC